jgi:pyruvate/2-oxoglutarate dehydrogenase complex dihydrolipoamide acyltransferase (E2) component
MSVEFKLPELGENISSGDIVNVLVQEGQTISANDGVVELETEKAVVEIPCPLAGKIAKIHVKKGDTVNVGQTVLTIEAEAAEPVTPPAPTKTAPAKATEPPPAAAAAEELLPAGPAARRLARELAVDLRQVRGSGPRGRITPEDVQAMAGAPAAPSGVSAKPEQAASGTPGQDAWGPTRREKMPRIRRAIAEQMARSASIIPHVTNFDDADITELDSLRAGVPDGYIGENIRLTLMPFVMKAVAVSLLRHPTLNASLNPEKEEVVYKQYVNVGVAVDTPRGLVVPVVRSADKLTLAQLAQALATAARRVREAQFGLDEVRGGTFTISNLGAVGGAYSTPIINHPEVAILLLGRSRWMPVVRGENHEKIDIRLMLPLSLSYDHRLVDGAAAGRFLNDVIACLQSPARLLL